MTSGILLLCCLFGVALSDNWSWYKNAVIYQIHVPSFQDSNGDGIGDLKGVRQRVEYISSLGVDAVSLSPIFPTSKNGGITDYKAIHHEYGNMYVFQDLLKALKDRGIRILLEIIPNHSSNEHEWFLKSENNDKNYSNYYVWRDPKGYDADKNPIPPNNWVSVLNTGTAWKWSEKRKQYYLHTFSENEPDLNYENSMIPDEMEVILKYWMMKGVDGFKMTAVSWLFEDQQFKDEPKSSSSSNNNKDYNSLKHVYTMDQAENVVIIQAFRAAIDKYSEFIDDNNKRILIVENPTSSDAVLRYYGNKSNPGAHFPMNFLLTNMTQERSATDFAKKIMLWGRAVGDNCPSWALGNFDLPRIASNWTDEWADIFHMIVMSLKGAVMTYYGEELGMEDSPLSQPSERHTPTIPPLSQGPMAWNSSTFGGFTSGNSPWTSLPISFWKKNVLDEANNQKSHLTLYKDLVAIRKSETLKKGELWIQVRDNDILLITRIYSDNPTVITAVNLGDELKDVNLSEIDKNLPEFMYIVTATPNINLNNTTSVSIDSIKLPPISGIVIAANILTDISQ